MNCAPITNNNHQHPIRPPKKSGEVYRRYIPEIKEVLSFRTADPKLDLAHFNQWMNQPCVNHFWEMAGDNEQHATYLSNQLADPHSHPLIACFNDVPFGYIEAYWAKEDRIAPFYDVCDYDRGFHVLVGDINYRGAHYFPHWLQGLARYLFSDELRCRRIVCEPRVDNTRFIASMQKNALVKLKEFDFPHKRAALMMMERDVFFEQFGI